MDFVGVLINIRFNIIYFIWFVILLVFNIASVMNFWYIFVCIYLYFMHINSIIYLFEMSQYLAMLLWRAWYAQNSCGPSLWRSSTKTVKQGVQRACAQSIPRPERTESYSHLDIFDEFLQSQLYIYVGFDIYVELCITHYLVLSRVLTYMLSGHNSLRVYWGGNFF